MNTLPSLPVAATKVLDVVQANNKNLPATVRDEVVAFQTLCSTANASKKTHYHELDDWSRPIYAFVRERLNEHGFVNGKPAINATNPAVQFWLALYQLPNSLIYSPYLKTDVARHHASAYERNQALMAALADILSHWDNTQVH